MKYVLTKETKEAHGRTLRRIKALKNFNGVSAGDLGGWVETYGNLSHTGGAWVYDDAEVYGDAEVSNDAWVYGDAKVYGGAEVCGDAKVSGDADYIVFKNWWTSGRYFTWTRSNNMWKVGCFYGTGDELVKKAHRDSEKSGREYAKVVKYTEQLLNNK